MKICGAMLPGQHPTGSNGPDSQDLHGWKQCQLQFGPLRKRLQQGYIAVDITEGNMKLKFDQVRVSVQFELLAQQWRLTCGWEVVYKMKMFFPILCRPSSEHAIALSLQRYGRPAVIS